MFRAQAGEVFQPGVCHKFMEQNRDNKQAIFTSKGSRDRLDNISLCLPPSYPPLPFPFFIPSMTLFFPFSFSYLAFLWFFLVKF